MALKSIFIDQSELFINLLNMNVVVEDYVQRGKVVLVVIVLLPTSELLNDVSVCFTDCIFVLNLLVL